MSTRISGYIKNQYPTTVYNRMRVKSPLAALIKINTVGWNMEKATGITPGINSPLTNPIIDLSGVVGKNLLDGITIQASSNAIRFDGLKYTFIASNHSFPYFNPNFKFISGQTYTFSWGVISDGANQIRIEFEKNGVKFYDSNYLTLQNSNIQVTMPTLLDSDVVKLKFFTANNLIYVKNSTVSNIQLELGSTATTPTPYGKANLLLQNFSGVSTDGFVDVVCPNGQTIPFLKFDGLNSYGLANHPTLDITGAVDFAIEVVFKSSTTIVGSYVVSKGDGLGGITQQQYSITTEDDSSIRFALNGTPIVVVPASTLMANTLYKLLIYRFSGVLKCVLSNVETYNTPNNVNILTKPYFRVGARTSTGDGLTHSLFTNLFIAHLAIINGAITPFTESELIERFNDFCRVKYGI